MAQIIQIKRGLKANLPTLLPGEMAFCTDTKEIYVGDGTNNTLVGRVMSGTEAARPSAGVAGRLYHVSSGTNVGSLYLDTGTAWVKVNVVSLDELSDGATYGKVKKTEISNGTVTRLNDGTNTVTASEIKSHIDDATKHRQIDDTKTTTTNLWSAAKVNSVIFNAIRGLEWQDSVINKTTTTPPSTPEKDDRYIIPANASGAWSGKTNQIAHYNGTAWEYYTPSVGWSVYVDQEYKNYVFNGTNWVKSGEANQTIVAGNGLIGGGCSDEITLSVGAGPGIQVSSSGVAVKEADGITVSSSGVGVKAGTGINVDSSGVSVKLGKGLEIDTSGNVGVRGSSSVSVADGRVMVTANRGLVCGPLGLEVYLDNETIKFGAGNELYVDKVDGGTF